MPVPTVCPSCGNAGRAPDELKGRRVKCPKCGVPFVVGQAAKPAAPKPSPTPAAAVQPASAAADHKACPFCGEKILAAAKKCKHCGETLDPAMRAAEEAQRAARQPRRRSNDPDDGDDRPAPHTTVIVNTPREFPHLLHLVLCFLTLGAWLPVYILHAILASRGGGKLLAFLIGVPICLMLLGCGGFVTFVAIGAALSPKTAPGAGSQTASTPPDQPAPPTPGPDAQPPKKADAGAMPDATLTVEAVKLNGDFAASAHDAAVTYVGKVIDVKGSVLDVQFEGGDVVIVNLDGGKVPGRVSCRMKPREEDVYALGRGCQVTLRGRCDGQKRLTNQNTGVQETVILVSDCMPMKIGPPQPKPDKTPPKPDEPPPGPPTPPSPPNPDPEVEAKVAALVKNLKSKQATARIQAADDLRQMGAAAASASRAICEALADPDQRVQVSALDALKAINPTLYKPVAAIVQEPVRLNHTLDVAAIGDMGPAGSPAVPVLIGFLQVNAQPAQAGLFDYGALVVDALVKVAPEDAAVLTAFIGWLGTYPDGSVRAEVAKALPAVKGGSKAAKALAQAVVADPVPAVRVAAAAALGEFAGDLAADDKKAVVQALSRAKTDMVQEVREAARAAMEKLTK